MRNPDLIDLEALNDLAQHPGWRLYRQKCEQTQVQIVKAALAAKSWDEFLKLQGRYEQCQTETNTLKVLADGIKQRAEKANKAGSELR